MLRAPSKLTRSFSIQTSRATSWAYRPRDKKPALPGEKKEGELDGLGDPTGGKKA